MSTPFDLLGIGADADERAIKSAYAKLLRTTRPDEDAEGFQRLNEAYQRALQICRARGGASRTARQQSPQVVVQFDPVPPATHAADGGAGESTSAGTGSTRPAARPLDAASRGAPALAPRRPVARPADAAGWQPAPAAQPAFDFQAFLARYRQHAEADDPRALQQWLAAEPGLWHLPTKQAVGRHLLKALFENPVPMTEDCLDATLDFFKLNDALSGVDPILLGRLKHRALGEWHVRSDLRALAWQLYGSAASRNLLELRKIRARCERPFAWPRALLATLRNGQYARRVGQILVRLCGGNLDDLPKVFDRESARFWIEAASRTLNRTRLIIFGFRSGLALVALPVLAMMVTTIACAGKPDRVDLETALVVTSALTATIVGCVWLWIAAAWLLDKFDELASRLPGWKAVRIGLTPALCISSLAIAQFMDPVLGTVAAIVSLLFAFWRYRARHGFRMDAGARIGLMMVFGFCASALSSLVRAHQSLAFLPAVLVSLVALAIWAFDMKKLYWRPSARNRAPG